MYSKEPGVAGSFLRARRILALSSNKRVSVLGESIIGRTAHVSDQCAPAAAFQLAPATLSDNNNEVTAASEHLICLEEPSIYFHQPSFTFKDHQWYERVYDVLTDEYDQPFCHTRSLILLRLLRSSTWRASKCYCAQLFLLVCFYGVW